MLLGQVVDLHDRVYAHHELIRELLLLLLAHNGRRGPLTVQLVGIVVILVITAVISKFTLRSQALSPCSLGLFQHSFTVIKLFWREVLSPEAQVDIRDQVWVQPLHFL